MVLPILIGVGITLVSVAVRSGARAWSQYLKLTPEMIAKMNGVKITHTNLKNFGTKYDTGLSPEILSRLDRYPGGFYMKMSEAEALMILGISPNDIEKLDDELLRKKHRRAMFINHPDKGGSPYLASKVNEARDLLMHSVLIKKSRG